MHRTATVACLFWFQENASNEYPPPKHVPFLSFDDDFIIELLLSSQVSHKHNIFRRQRMKQPHNTRQKAHIWAIPTTIAGNGTHKTEPCELKP